MVDHKLRLLIIGIALVAVLGTLVTFYVTDTGEGIRERLEGMLGLLSVALVDSAAEQRKRVRETVVPQEPAPEPEEKEAEDES